MRRETASLRFDLLDRLGMVAEATGVPVETVLDKAAVGFLDGVSAGLASEDRSTYRDDLERIAAEERPERRAALQMIAIMRELMCDLGCCDACIARLDEAS